MVRRAAVLIGVSESGGLPPLFAVFPGIANVESWARNQDFETVCVLTDQDCGVGVRAIQDAIAEIVRRGSIDQLVVYFAGHGVNIGQSEYWLLSDAPSFTNEAVNVAGSAALARHCGVPHVIFISDTCRTAADGIIQQSLKGTDVFPNDEGHSSNKVDLFYACALGTPALEIKDPLDAADGYDAIYTTVLVDALTGCVEDVLESDTLAGPPVSVVRPSPLGDYLETEVGRRLAQLVPSGERVQTPDAIVTSRADAWLSCFDGLPRSRETRGPSAPQYPVTISDVARAGLAAQLRGADFTPYLSDAVDRRIAGSGAVLESVQVIGRRSDRPPFPSSAAFLIRGGVLTSAWTQQTSFLEPDGPDLAHLQIGPGGTTTALLELDNGTIAVLPAFPGLMAVVNVHQGEVVDIGYEPLRGAHEPTSLRALIAATTHQGAFRITSQTADALAEQLQAAESIDPGLAVRLAYAFNDIQREDLLLDLRQRLAEELGAVPFDVAMLAGAVTRRSSNPPVLPAMPMLARGWAVVDALGARLSPAVADLRRHLVPAVWTQFSGNAAELARTALRSSGDPV